LKKSWVYSGNKSKYKKNKPSGQSGPYFTVAFPRVFILKALITVFEKAVIQQVNMVVFKRAINGDDFGVLV
jgi:hypothetical protein